MSTDIRGAQTLGKRKSAYQQRVNGSGFGIRTTANGKLEYDSDYINQQLKQEYGYNYEYLYMNSDEESELEQKPEKDREELLAERHQKCDYLKEKLQMQLQLQGIPKHIQQAQEELQALKLQQKQQRLAKPRIKKQFEEDDDRSVFSSEEDDKSEESDYDEGNKRKRDLKSQVKKEKQEDSEEGEIHYASSSDDVVQVNKNSTKVVATKKGLPVRHVKEVTELEEIQKITLKRTKLEQWVDQMFFIDTVIGCLVKVSFRGQYVLGEIVDVKEEGQSYDLGKVKTNTQLLVKIGKLQRLFKIILVSNKDVLLNEFQEMQKLRKSEQIHPITQDHLQRKLDDLQQAKKFTYNQDQIDEMVASKFDKQIKQGKLGGFNLSFTKIDLQNDIGLFERKVRDEKNPSLRAELQRQLNDLREKLQIVEKQLKQQLEKDKSYFKTADERVLTIEELEKRQEAEEWEKLQEFYANNPEFKRNNYFTKDKIYDHALNQDLKLKQKKSLQQELDLLRQRSQQAFKESKKESYYDRMCRIQREYKAFHQQLTFKFEEIWERRVSEDGQVSIDFHPEKLHQYGNKMEQEGLVSKRHPDWDSEYMRVCEEEAMKIGQDARVKVISFEDYQ